MSQQGRFNGCQIVGIILAVLLIATACLAAGCVLGGGIGLVSGGAAGYAIGRARPMHVQPHIEIPVPPSPPEEPPTAEEPEAGTRPYLGVRVLQLERGAEIVEIVPEGPAMRAGLREGDLILEVDGADVTRARPLPNAIAAHEPGDTVQLTIERDGRRQELEVTLGAWSGAEEPGDK